MKDLVPVVAALLAILSSLASPAADACSLQTLPRELQVLEPGEGIPPLGSSDGGGDAVEPGKVTVSEPGVTFFSNPCDGSGASCPDMDYLQFNVSATDDATPLEQLRYVAAFGDTAAAASSAEPAILFAAEGNPAVVQAYLGIDGARAGDYFNRATLCFTVSAVDAAGNVGPRSDALCLDTRDRSASHARTVPGSPCATGFGCSAAGALPLAASVLLLAGALRRRRTMR